MIGGLIPDIYCILVSHVDGGPSVSPKYGEGRKLVVSFFATIGWFSTFVFVSDQAQGIGFHPGKA